MADIYTLIDRDGTPFQVMAFSPPDGRKRAVRIVILPGANCDAKRYRWLAEPLSAGGAIVLVPNPPQLEHPSPADPKGKKKASFVTIDQLIKILAMPWADDQGDGLTFIVGHSLGGSILLEYLDPAQAMLDPRSGVDAGYAPPVLIHGGVVIGATLQVDVMRTTIPWRQNDTALTKPPGLPLLFLAGEFDGMATPELVSDTVARYMAPTAKVVQKGCNHFGWIEGRGEFDLRQLDGKALIDERQQKQHTLRLVTAFLSTIADERPEAIVSALKNAAADGDEVSVR